MRPRKRFLRQLLADPYWRLQQHRAWRRRHATWRACHHPVPGPPMFCEFTMFSATGSGICATVMTRTLTTNSRPARGLTVHIPQIVSRVHPPTSCQVGKNIIWSVTLVISTILAWAVNFAIYSCTITNGKCHKRPTLVVILCRTPMCWHSRLVHISLYRVKRPRQIILFTMWTCKKRKNMGYNFTVMVLGFTV
jgi:hypothetical protein